MIHEPFRKGTHKIIWFVGSVWAFLLAFVAFFTWIIVGFFVHFSHNWELVFIVATTAVIFLSLFLIQHKHNRDMLAINIKLDALIFASSKTKNDIIDVENLSDATLHRRKSQMKKRVKKLKKNS